MRLRNDSSSSWSLCSMRFKRWRNVCWEYQLKKIENRNGFQNSEKMINTSIPITLHRFNLRSDWVRPQNTPSSSGARTNVNRINTSWWDLNWINSVWSGASVNVWPERFSFISDAAAFNYAMRLIGLEMLSVQIGWSSGIYSRVSSMKCNRI